MNKTLPQRLGGSIRNTATADPAAGAEVAAITITTNSRAKLLLYRVQMVQGLTQTPHPALLIRDGSDNTVALIPIGATIAASTTVDCTWGVGIAPSTDNANNGAIAASLPDIPLLQGYDILTQTRGIGANSNYGVARAIIQEYFED